MNTVPSSLSRGTALSFLIRCLILSVLVLIRFLIYPTGSRERPNCRDLKIVILGDASVGKTSLIQRYLQGIFTGDNISTIGASFFLKQWGPYNVAIWDTAGEERFSGLSSFYCRGASAAIIAYDITQGRSLQALQERHLQLLDASEPNCLVVVVGTKTDLVTSNSREIQSSAGERLALEQNEKKGRLRSSFKDKPFFETSAKTGENVEEVFDFILNTCLPLDDEETAKNSLRRTSGLDLQQKSSNSRNGTKKCC